jgi:microcystin-dependent protein
MPTDSNGVYSLPAGYLATTGGTIAVTQHNPILEDIATALTARLPANGSKAMTAPLKHVDGTAAAPAMSFATATNLGLYKTANGLGVSVAGVKVAEFTSAGLASGVRYIGEIFDWTGSAAPALCVLPYGQTLSRTTYAELWTFAQAEIAAGSTLYNNGNGSTTFGILDCRGRVRAGKDNMGGSAASRLTGTSVSPDGNTLGANGGTQTHSLTLAQLPTGITSVNASQAISVTSTQNGIPSGQAGSSAPVTGGSRVVADWGAGVATLSQITSTGNNSISVTSNNTSGAAHPNVQPTIITNCALFAGV